MLFSYRGVEHTADLQGLTIELYPTAAEYLGQKPSFSEFKGTELYQHICSLTTVK